MELLEKVNRYIETKEQEEKQKYAFRLQEHTLDWIRKRHEEMDVMKEVQNMIQHFFGQKDLRDENRFRKITSIHPVKINYMTMEQKQRIYEAIEETIQKATVKKRGNMFTSSVIFQKDRLRKITEGIEIDPTHVMTIKEENKIWDACEKIACLMMKETLGIDPACHFKEIMQYYLYLVDSPHIMYNRVNHLLKEETVTSFTTPGNRVETYEFLKKWFDSHSQSLNFTKIEDIVSLLKNYGYLLTEQEKMDKKQAILRKLEEEFEQVETLQEAKELKNKIEEILVL